MIKINDLHKSFGSLHVLKGVDFQAKEGEVVAIIGPSGMGKSTFLRCVNYIERPDKGKLEIDGVKVDVEKSSEKTIKELRAKSSIVFQNYNVFKNKTVIENVMLPMVAVQKMQKAIAQERAEEYLQKLD